MRNKITVLTALLFTLSNSSFASTESWELDHSTLIYTISHPLKTAKGTSAGAKGKGKCEKGKCEFLIAAPLKSFDSGDSNRDLHMLEVTRGGTYPMVVAQASFESDQTNVPATFNVKLAGKEAVYQNVLMDVQKSGGNLAHAKGVLVIKLSDFAIEPPSLLTMTIKNEVPIAIDAYWKIEAK